MKQALRFLFVGLGVIVLTSFSVDATDALRGSQSALSIVASTWLKKGCPEGTTQMDLATGTMCIDTYENAPSANCPLTEPSSVLETKKNIETASCISVSIPDAPVWTYVSYTQAKQLCAKKQMRLPTPSEWFEASLGTPDTIACNIDSGGKRVSGFSDTCVSSRGIYDAVGNVWEWVDAIIQDTQYNQRQLPQEGYVTDIDADGIAVVTAQEGAELYNQDYFWTGQGNNQAMVRGGFYGAGTDAGLYAVNTKVTPSFQSAAIGFRCVQDLN